ncbi:hypothetical protein ACFYWS_33890 [Streptomyces sp. NPDC002795]|uniref:hypothetical protein n=1 Tax=Streptomyces sp. NPDC002795 TaxID=3364665 RepID=UPI0036C42BB8
MRRLRWVAGLLSSMLLFLAVPVVSVPLSYAAEPPSYLASYMASYVAEPSPHGSLAGSRAGVGRTPPGRELPSPAATGAVLPPAPTEPAPAVPTRSQEPRPERSASATPEQQGAGERQAVGEPGNRLPLVNVLPLGAGLLLTGLGFGLLALRLRR